MFQIVTIALALSTVASDGDPPPKFSLPTEEDRVAWQDPGFRMQLGFVYDRLYGFDDAPDAKLMGGLLRVGARITKRWSLLGSFQYTGSATRDADALSGFRFATTLDPTWHFAQAFDLAVGFGMGGFVEANGCNGVGPLALMRLGWMLELDIKVVKGLGQGLTEAAMAAIKACRFSPGEHDGKTVAVRLASFKIRFVLGAAR